MKNKKQQQYKFKIREYNYVDIGNTLAKETTIEFDTLEDFVNYMSWGIKSHEKYLYGDYELVDIYDVDVDNGELEEYIKNIIERVDEFELKGDAI